MNRFVRWGAAAAAGVAPFLSPLGAAAQDADQHPLFATAEQHFSFTTSGGEHVTCSISTTALWQDGSFNAGTEAFGPNPACQTGTARVAVAWIDGAGTQHSADAIGDDIAEVGAQPVHPSQFGGSDSHLLSLHRFQFTACDCSSPTYVISPK
jgi:hypothetical protein